MSHRLENKKPPTQVTHPWRSTARVVIAAAIGILPLLPDIADAADIDTVPAVVSVLAVTAAVQRVLAIEGVDAWLTRYLGIGAEPKPKEHNR
ncbi:hypothetical protein HW450_10355 [Corynebacterium hindlerae]|uniref:Uncharacterized protein n=1 Tax=Corynebacterium hindlerae TaxID=699041 RepID=A0A7G5FDP4_9CORY|nr:hypothetical protein [Corynebacterium hindlerae]QMV84735.1 hypothetical protein HW450_10355 [Corynebacterium hindlerae]